MLIVCCLTNCHIAAVCNAMVLIFLIPAALCLGRFEQQIFTLMDFFFFFPSSLQVQYGIFPDNFTFNILLDCFIKQKKYEGKKIGTNYLSFVASSYICRAFL